jgi:hypothetical protein
VIELMVKYKLLPFLILLALAEDLKAPRRKAEDLTPA